MEDWGGKPNKGSIDKKPPELNEEMCEENRKIVESCNYCQWKKHSTLN